MGCGGSDSKNQRNHNNTGSIPKDSMIKTLILVIALSFSAWAQVNCEFSNTGAHSGTASVNAATGQGFSAPGGIGAVGFRVRIPCIATYVSFAVLTVDSSASSAPNTYDIGIYCVKGDCESGGNTNKLWFHTGPIAGRNFTNNRLVTTVTGVGASISGGVLSLTKASGFLLPDFPIGGKVTVSACSPFNASYAAVTVSTSVITVASALTGSASGCTVKSSASYPPGFPVANTCPSTPGAGAGDTCMQAFPWIADARTVCTVIPCNLPSGTYAAAIGTNCSSATATSCAQLRGDDDFGFIYPFVASAATYDASGLPASITFPTIGPTTPVWNTTPGTSAPVKPVKLLIY